MRRQVAARCRIFDRRIRWARTTVRHGEAGPAQRSIQLARNEGAKGRCHEHTSHGARAQRALAKVDGGAELAARCQRRMAGGRAPRGRHPPGGSTRISRAARRSGPAARPGRAGHPAQNGAPDGLCEPPRASRARGPARPRCPPPPPGSRPHARVRSWHRPHQAARSHARGEAREPFAVHSLVCELPAQLALIGREGQGVMVAGDRAQAPKPSRTAAGAQPHSARLTHAPGRDHGRAG